MEDVGNVIKGGDDEARGCEDAKRDGASHGGAMSG